jgi:hypothetical protein
LQRLAVRLERRARWARAVGAVGVARGFAAAMREELDFRVEARNTAAVAANWAAQQRVVRGSVSVTLPAVHEQLCSEHVLVIEWLDGLSLRAAGPLIDDRGLDRAALSRALLRSTVYPDHRRRHVPRPPAPDRVTGALEQGRLGLNVRLLADERDRRVVTGLTHQFLLTFLGAASGIVAALLLGAPGGLKVAPTVSLYQVIGYNLLIVAAIHVQRVLFTIFRNR